MGKKYFTLSFNKGWGDDPNKFFYNDFLKRCNVDDLPESNNNLASANVKPRLRMTILYYYAAIYHCLVIGTGNKTELNVGYFTKYGDGGVDLLPIGDLYKEEVVQVAKELGVPDSIIEKPPTAGLLPNQTDETELGMTYPVLDRLLYLYLDEHCNAEEISDKLDFITSAPDEYLVHIILLSYSKLLLTIFSIISKKFSLSSHNAILYIFNSPSNLQLDPFPFYKAICTEC